MKKKNKKFKFLSVYFMIVVIIFTLEQRFYSSMFTQFNTFPHISSSVYGFVCILLDVGKIPPSAIPLSQQHSRKFLNLMTTTTTTTKTQFSYPTSISTFKKYFKNIWEKKWKNEGKMGKNAHFKSVELSQQHSRKTICLFTLFNFK